MEKKNSLNNLKNALKVLANLIVVPGLLAVGGHVAAQEWRVIIMVIWVAVKCGICSFALMKGANGSVDVNADGRQICIITSKYTTEKAYYVKQIVFASLFLLASIIMCIANFGPYRYLYITSITTLLMVAILITEANKKNKQYIFVYSDHMEGRGKVGNSLSSFYIRLNDIETVTTQGKWCYITANGVGYRVKVGIECAHEIFMHYQTQIVKTENRNYIM